MAIEIKIKKHEFGGIIQLEVQWIENGIKNKDKTYWTDDENEAKKIKSAMERGENLTTCRYCGEFLGLSHINNEICSNCKKLRKKDDNENINAKVGNEI